MKLAFRKVWRDLWINRGRTVLVVLSIAVGVMALGLTLTSNRLINDWMDRSRIASNPAQARLTLDLPFDQEVVDTIAALPEIEDAEGWATAEVRWKPALDAPWQDASLIAHADFSAQTYDLIELISGGWPQGETVAVEFNHLPHYNVPSLGSTIYFEGPNRTVSLVLSGAIRDPVQSPPPFNLFGQPAFYVDLDGLETITGRRDLTWLRFGIPDYSEEKAKTAAEVVEERLDRLGARSAVVALSIDITDPDRSRAQEFMDGLGVILVTMAFMSLGLSIFLVVNTINAIIASQIRQIGIMKTVGAVRRQIATIYLSSVLVYGLLSIFIALPLGAAGGYQLAKWLLFALNVQVDRFEIMPDVLALQAIVGLASPLAAASIPVIRGTAISAREAIGSYGIGRGIYGTRKIDLLLARWKGMPRMTALSLRNTFRFGF